MHIVIEIPEKTVNEIKDNAMFAGTIPSEILWDVTSAIVNGIPIPKGHGKVWEENDIKRSIKNEYQLVTILTGLEMVKPIIEAEWSGEE